MKKDRNTFFSEYGYNSMNSGFPGMMMPNNQTFSANSSMYAGPAINPNVNNNMYSDIDARLSKIERQINRLETRVSRLEGDTSQTNVNIDDVEYNANSMYMV
jgi:hypothetical protein